MILSRSRLLPFAMVALGALAFWALGAAILAHVAHAAAVVDNPVVIATPVSAGLDWQVWIAIGIGVIGGAKALLEGVAMILRPIAPRTKTTIDDGVLASVEAAHAKLDELLGIVKVWQPAPTSVNVTNVVPPAGSGTAAMLVVVLLAGLGGGLACTSAQRTELGQAAWNCTDSVRADAVAAVTPAVISVIRAAASADGKLIDLSTVKSAISKANLRTEAGVLLACAAATAFAWLGQPTPAMPGAPMSAGLVIDPAALRTAWSAIDTGQLGGARFTVAVGGGTAVQ